MPILSIPDLAEPVFAEPWQAQAFALTVSLHEGGLFTWPEWAEALGARVRQQEGEDYYAAWLAALESLVITKGVADRETLATLRDAWSEAYRHTPHGQPVSLDSPVGA